MNAIVYLRRSTDMQDQSLDDQLAAIQSFDDVTEKTVLEVLRQSGYPWKPQGVKVVLRLKDHVLQGGYSWGTYFQSAEEAWTEGFETDELLEWKFVKLKVRDFALSEFSRYFCAIDSRLINVLCRTGLMCHGFGDPEISGGPSYRFCRCLVQRFSQETGWSEAPNGLSPGEIDRMFWYFAQDRCGKSPHCGGCRLREICCTGRESLTKPASGSPLHRVATQRAVAGAARTDAIRRRDGGPERASGAEAPSPWRFAGGGAGGST